MRTVMESLPKSIIPLLLWNIKVTSWSCRIRLKIRLKDSWWEASPKIFDTLYEVKACQSRTITAAKFFFFVQSCGGENS